MLHRIPQTQATKRLKNVGPRPPKKTCLFPKTPAYHSHKTSRPDAHSLKNHNLMIHQTPQKDHTMKKKRHHKILYSVLSVSELFLGLREITLLFGVRSVPVGVNTKRRGE